MPLLKAMVRHFANNKIYHKLNHIRDENDLGFYTK